jgi:hypothetical protein
LRTFRLTYQILLISAIAIASSGCAAYKLDQAQMNLRNSMAHGNYQEAGLMLDRMDRKDVYKKKDAVLLNLERGMIHRVNGDYQQSTLFFQKAEDDIEANFTRSISRAAASVLVNDNVLDYPGEDYEDVYLNAFKALNFIHLNDFDAALVEARRMAYKLENMELRNKGFAETYARQDSLGHADWTPGKSNIQNSAFSHYLSAVLFAKTGRPDNARIETQRVFSAMADQQAAYNFNLPPAQELAIVQEPDQYNLLITAFSGRAPIKDQVDVRLFLDEIDSYVKFSFPSLHMYNSVVDRVEIIVGDTISYPVYLIEDMDRVSAEVYRVKQPLIYAKALARGIAKTVGANAIRRQAEKQSEGLGFAAFLLGILGQEVSEKADLRSWVTMPGSVHANVINLPEGHHTLEIMYLSKRGAIVYTEKHDVHITGGNSLSLIESLYWN